MTNEEAIKKLKSFCHSCSKYPQCVNTDRECFEALDTAIRALKNEQTDGDLISRELAKQMVRDRFNDLSERVEINTVLNEVPSAEKTAEWIFVDNKKIIAKCSNCTLLHDTMYGTRHCPNCGAKMKGGTE